MPDFISKCEDCGRYNTYRSQQQVCDFCQSRKTKGLDITAEFLNLLQGIKYNLENLDPRLPSRR